VYLVLCVWFLLAVNTSASDCLERLVPEIIYYVSRGTLNSAHSLLTPACCCRVERLDRSMSPIGYVVFWVHHSHCFASTQRSVAGGILFSSCSCMRVCVRECIPVSPLHPKTLLTNLLQSIWHILPNLHLGRPHWINCKLFKKFTKSSALSSVCATFS